MGCTVRRGGLSLAAGQAATSMKDLGWVKRTSETLLEEFAEMKEGGAAHRWGPRAQEEANLSGLAALQGLVTAHDGSIKVDAFPGEGSTFTISLPALPD